MHDPDTQAFVIPYGYRMEKFNNGEPWRYWKPLFTIWHHDPERGGSDDSCGWFKPKLNKKQREICKSLGADEAYSPWFTALDAKSNLNPVQCELLVRGAILLVALCLENRKVMPGGKVSIEATLWDARLTHNGIDNLRSSLCFKSGWHSNWYKEGIPNTIEEDKYFRERNAVDLFSCIMGYILRERRPWYKHPKWHVWHWRIQCHPLQQLKRRLFSKCCKCGRGFKWGYSPCSDAWNGTGPLWFRSEKYIYHADCQNPASSYSAQLEAK